MDSGRDGTELTSTFSIPVSWLVLGAAVLAVVGAAFYGGMAYERHERDADLAAISELGGTSRERDTARASEEPESLELQVDEPVEAEGPDGSVTLTLNSVGLVETYTEGRPQRYIELAVTMENLTGKRTSLASLNGHFEDNLGQKPEHVLTTCIEGRQLPADPVPVGRFAKGCESMSIPDDAGRIVLDGFTPALYVEVPAA